MFLKVKGIVTQLSYKGWDEENKRKKKIEEFTQFSAKVYKAQDVKLITFSEYGKVPFLPPEPRDLATHIIVRIELYDRNLPLEEFLIRKGEDESNILKITAKANNLGIRVKDLGRENTSMYSPMIPTYMFLLSKVLPKEEFTKLSKDPNFVPKTTVSFLCSTCDSVIDDFPHLNIQKRIGKIIRAHNVPVPDFVKIATDPRVGRIQLLFH